MVFKLITESELGAASLYELRRLLSAPEVKDPACSMILLPGEVVFDRVTFAYGRAPATSRRRQSVSGRESSVQAAARSGVTETAGRNGAQAKTNARIPTPADGDFPPAKPVLDSVSFKITPGTFAAIVGQSGSGKTTLFYMLLRLLEPHDGDMLLGGFSVGDILLKMLRDFIGFIPAVAVYFLATDPAESTAEARA